jgi:hypothetical protein
VAALALIAGCSTRDPTSPPPSSTSPVTTSPSTTSTASASSTATGSATTGASDIPEAARANTPDGAVAFVSYFARQANEAYLNLTPEVISHMSEDSCKTCKGMMDAINGWKNKNQRYEGQFISPTYTAISSFPNDGTAKVLVTSKTSGGRIVDANGSTVSKFDAEAGNLSIALVRVPEGWSISSIQATA